MGVLPTQLKFLVNGQIAKLNAILKKLQQRNLVKTLSSVVKGGKKVWMCFETEPNIDVTGGIAGSDSFDLMSMAVVMERVLAYTKKQGLVSKKELLIYIKQQGILTSDQIRDDDLQQIIEVMALDQKIEKCGNEMFKAANWQYPTQTLYLATPCANCLLKQECGPQNRINPQTCSYMKDWLS